MAEVTYDCYVGNIASTVDEQSLKRAFSQYGEVIKARIVHDRETERSKGFGFVTFKDQYSRTAAAQGMNGQLLDGRVIRVNEVANSS